jgi:hypothetical protein
MSVIRSASAALAILAVVTSGAALAQTASPSTTPSDTSSSPTSSTVDDVSKWTSKEWNKAKAKWAKEKDKWADCQKQSKDQKLSGRKSWSFLASCMSA